MGGLTPRRWRAHQCRNARDAARALRFGAEGIGLCRTEHMFFDPAALLVRQMILAANATAREKALTN